MDISNLNICVNEKYTNYKFYKSFDLPYPLFFAIPTLAFHVRTNKVTPNTNFIEDTILYLKNNGMSEEEISDKLCLDPKIIEIIITNNAKNQKVEKGKEVETKTDETADYYIFYNLITEEFIKDYMPAETFHMSCSKFDMQSYKAKDKVYYYRKNIGDSNYTKINFLDNGLEMSKPNIIPTEQNILEAILHESAFNKESYTSAEYLNEVHPVWLTFPYTVTKYNAEEMSAISPFTDYTTYSNYLYKLVEDYAITDLQQFIIQDYKDEIKKEVIKKHNKNIVIKNAYENSAYAFLNRKYANKNFFSGTMQEQMVKMQSTFSQINASSNVDNLVRQFYDYANSTLEQLLMNTLSPYLINLSTKLHDDKFYERLAKEKTNLSEKIIIEKYFDCLEKPEDSLIFLEQSTVKNLTNAIKRKDLFAEKSFKLGICDLYTLNVMALYFNKNSAFKNIFKCKDENIQKKILTIFENRKEVKHTYATGDIDNVEKSINAVYEIVDSVYDVKNVKIDNVAKVDQAFESYIGEYKGLNNINKKLQESCSQLISDTYNADTNYYSDCVIAFERIGECITDFCLNGINSRGEIHEIFKSLPQYENETRDYLCNLLKKNGIDPEPIGRLTISSSKAKTALLGNLGNLPATTGIFFPLILLSKVDYVSFISLITKLGNEFISDAAESIKIRKHDGQADDWKQIKIINDRYINYCEIITSFMKEEL